MAPGPGGRALTGREGDRRCRQRASCNNSFYRRPALFRHVRMRPCGKIRARPSPIRLSLSVTTASSTRVCLHPFGRRVKCLFSERHFPHWPRSHPLGEAARAPPSSTLRKHTTLITRDLCMFCSLCRFCSSCSFCSFCRYTASSLVPLPSVTS